MKNILKGISGLFFLMMMIISCSPDSVDHPSEAGMPKISDVNIKITVGAENVVTFEIENQGVAPIWIFGEDDLVMGNLYKKTYGKAGTYSVEVKVYNSNGISDGSVVKEFTLTESLLTPDLLYISGGTSKRWIMDKNTPGHIGCGAGLEVGGSNGLDWWYEEGANGWGNNEIQNYIPAVKGSDTCAVVADGNLNIIAKKVGNQIYSIRMNTRKYWTYGYFEGRLKLPKGKGLWSAFWMMPQNYKSWPEDGEIDIMEEVGYDPNTIHSSIHCKAYYHKINTQKTATKYVNGAEGEFHIYAVEWTPDFIKGYVDGECYFEFYNDHKGNYDTWPFDNPFYLKLNLAWGGDWGGNMGVDESVLPAVYEIDYIRVFQKD